MHCRKCKEFMTFTQLTAYKNLSVVEKVVNDASKYMALPAVLCGLCIIQILCFYGSLKASSNFATTPTLCMFFIVCNLNLSLGILLTHSLAAKVYIYSENLLHDWKREIAGSNKLRRKQLNAAIPIRIRFFSSFVGNSTPLVSQNFIAVQTASLILMH